MKTLFIYALAFTMMLGQAQAQSKTKKNATMKTQETEHYTFKLSDKVTRQKVTFKNRYGITLTGDLYLPKDKKGPLSAIAISGPFGAVKEQSS